MRDNRMVEKRERLHADLQDVIQRVLVEQEVPESVAEIAANAVGNRLADYWAGQSVFFPTHAKFKLAARELLIYDLFTGRNQDELCRRFNMSDRGINKLIARVRARIAEGQPSNQRDLLDPPEQS